MAYDWNLISFLVNEFRYFHGVQNDPAKRGELFGIENIFTLHEDTLATKMAVRGTHLALSW